jgi:hypothetical protein
VKTGVQEFCNYSIFLDSGFRRNDGCGSFLTFDEAVIVDALQNKRCSEGAGQFGDV